MANDQNTIAGTADGGSVINTNGNWFLDALSGLSNVAVGVGSVGSTALDVYTSFRSRAVAAGLIRDQQQQAPQQTAPSNLISNPLDYLSDPNRVQKLLVISGMGMVLLLTTVYVIKKVK